MITIGVLALQGAFARHVAALEAVGVRSLEVRTPSDLDEVDALVIPGGESTTISKLLVSNELLEPLRKRLEDDMPVFGTCAGLILLADEILDGRADQISLGVLDASVRRNAYGRQIDSFEADLAVQGLDEPLRAVFIRAPVIERIGPEVEVLAESDGTPVLCRQGATLVASFHPELTDDVRLHELFVAMVAEAIDTVDRAAQTVATR